jgi:hypothetical protein
MSTQPRRAVESPVPSADAASSALETALAEVLLPALEPAGFARFGSRNVGRVRDGVLQFVNVQAAAFGPRRFCVNYAALPLFRPHTVVALGRGDRLRDTSGEDAWWPAQDLDEACAGMRAAAVGLLWQASPWFEKTRTVAGLLECLPALAAGADPHDVFDRACCLARQGLLREAAHVAARARRLFLRDGRQGFEDLAENCAMLFAAALAGHVEPLLAQWQRQSARHLHLGRLRGA